MPKPISKSASGKPAKPYPDFPLFAHATKRWAKKIKGKLFYFGPWSDPEGAIKKYEHDREARYAGRTPRPTPEGATVRDLANRFLTSKRHLADNREITPRTFADYHATCERVVTAFGRERLVSDLVADDFERLRAILAKTWGPVALGNQIQRVRSLFKFGYEAGIIDKPVRYGPAFRRPAKKVVRQSRQAKGPRMFEAQELRTIIEAAGVPLKAMILLGINCGFGNADVGTLPLSAVDLQGGWVNYPRPKTAIPRRAKLWPETIAALKAAIAGRPKPKEPADSGLTFVTKYGEPWHKRGVIGETGAVAGIDNPVAKEATKLLKDLDLHRPGLGFYALRHTFETIGGESRDQPAVDHVMGHAPNDNDMSAVYRERVTDERLKAVSDHVHGWLFAKPSAQAKARAKKRPTPAKKPARRLRVVAG